MFEYSLSLKRCLWLTFGIGSLNGFVASTTWAQPASWIDELPPPSSSFSASSFSVSASSPVLIDRSTPTQVKTNEIAERSIDSSAANSTSLTSTSSASTSLTSTSSASTSLMAVPPENTVTAAELNRTSAPIDPATTQAIDLLEPTASLEPTTVSPVHAIPPDDIAQLEPEIKEQEAEEETEDLTVPVGQGETLTEIQVRFVDREGQPIEGNTQPEIITREFELQPGDVYDPALAKQGLEQIIRLTAVQDANLTLEPGADPAEASLIINVREAPAIGFIAGNQVARPSVLRGITLPRPTSTSPLRIGGFQVPASVQWGNIGGLDQSLTFGVLLGDQANGFDLTFANPWVVGTDRIGYALNINGLGYLNPTFNDGDEEVELPNGNEDFWERRVGGGIQIVQRPTPELAWAAGISYQQVSIRDALTGTQLFTEDEYGNALVLSDDGIDSLLTVNAALVLDSRNDVNFPTSGSRLQLGIDQSIPVGDANILYTRPMGNFTQFLPLSFIEVDGTPSTLLFNIQGGSLLGDAPPYEAFVLGGSSSVRGYGSGEVASPQTFLQSSLEYRIPFAVLKPGQGLFQELLGERILFAGNLFADYATGFGTQALMIGEPGVVRDKPGEGFGFGVGLLATSSFGLARLEVGVSDRGDVAVFFTIGDRF